MKIMHNISAMFSQRYLSINMENMSKSQEKLSSGYRINRAGDDAAGLAVSEKFRTQIDGLDQSSRNAQDSISMIQTAEAGLEELHSILQRMRVLAVQSSNDTLTNEDRGLIQLEIQQLLEEVNRMQTSIQFNTKLLLTGSYNDSNNWNTRATQITCSAATSYQLAGAVSNTLKTGMGALGNSALSITSTATWSQIQYRDGQAEFTGANQYSVDYYNGKIHFSSQPNLSNTKISYNYGAANLESMRTAVPAGAQATSSQIQLGTGYAIGTTFYTTGSLNLGGSISMSAASSKLGGFGNVQIAGKTEVILNNGQAEFTAADQFSVDYDKGIIYFADYAGACASTVFSAEVKVGNIKKNELLFHIGANENQTLGASIQDMSTTGLGIDTLGTSLRNSIETRENAERAIGLLSTAINTVSSLRANLGAYQNRLEHSYDFINTSKENQQSAESRIRDVDFASEMTEFTKQQVLAQASQAMLSQANMISQMVLQLLK